MTNQQDHYNKERIENERQARKEKLVSDGRFIDKTTNAMLWVAFAVGILAVLTMTGVFGK